jgi:hypothetical protein
VAEVEIDVEAGLVGIEGFRAVRVRYGDWHQLELEAPGTSSFLGVAWASARSASVLPCRRPLMMAVGSAQPWQRGGARRREPGAALELVEQTVRAVSIA